MTPAALLAVVLVAAAPGAGTEVGAAAGPTSLKVRVLEKYRPTRARIEAPVLFCDAKPLPAAREASVSLARGKLSVDGKRTCRTVRAADARVRLSGNVDREYRGQLLLKAGRGQIVFLNEVEVDDYLRSVLGSEQSGASLETLKAQAVVSRTFALAGGRHKAESDLCDLAHCQVYLGKAAENADADKAVHATRGVVVRRGDKLTPAYFHGSCGGATSAPRDVFGESSAFEGAGDVDEKTGQPWCARALAATWTWTVPRDAFARALGVPARGKAFEVVKADRGGRVIQARCFGVRLSGNELSSKVGKAFGWSALKSLKVEVEESGGEVRFKGRGVGHGVGLCQWGARALEKAGKDWRSIVLHYFPGAELSAPQGSVPPAGRL